MKRSFAIALLFSLATTRAQAFSVLLAPTTTTSTRRSYPSGSSIQTTVGTPRPTSANDGGALAAYYDATGPSDYDEVMEEKGLEVDKNEEDAEIRDAIKRELLLLSSVSNRGEYCSVEEQNMCIDLVAQLEALNPSPDPAHNQDGEWDLCLSSTQFFRTSPFFQSIRTAVGDANKATIDTAFDIHDRATTSGRVGRVRQIISKDQLVSEVELEVGMMPGLPVRVKGTVVTTASLKAISSEAFETQIEATSIKSSNIPFVDQWLDDSKFEVPLKDVYSTFGEVPICPNKIFYLDEGMRITRDQDDNFFVYTRA